GIRDRNVTGVQRVLFRSLIIYASTPISPRGGGVEKVNLAIAASVKARLEKMYGHGAWVIDPGVYQLPKVDGKDAGGSEYMVMWTRVLGGDDGAGRDIDTAHFTGPADMRAFFGDRKSTRLNSSHVSISYAVFCLKKKKLETHRAHP